MRNIVFSSDGALVVVGAEKFVGMSVEHVLTLWDVATGRQLHTFRDTNVMRYGWSFSPDGKLLALPGGRAGVLVREVAGGKVVGRLDHPGADTAEFSPDGKHLVTRTYVGAGQPRQSLRVWDVATGKEVYRTTDEMVVPFPLGFFATNGRLVFITEIDRVRTWNPSTGAEDPPVKIAGEPTGFLSPSADGRWFLTVPGGRPSLHDRTGKVVRTFGGDGAGCTFARFSPDGSRVVGGTTARRVTVWDTISGAERGRFTVPDSDSPFGPTVWFTPDGRYLLASWSQPTAGRTDLESAAAVYTLDGLLVRRDRNVWHDEFDRAGKRVVVVRRTVNAAGGVTGFDVTVHDAAAWLAGGRKD